MTITVICDEGFEDVVAQNLKENYSFIKETTIEPTVITIPSNNLDHAAELAYTFQGAIKVLFQTQTFECKHTLESCNTEKATKTLDEEITKLNPTYTTYKTTCVRKGNHDFKSVDLASKCSRTMLKDKEFDFKNADLNIFIYVKDEKGYIGIDIANRTLSKRDYKIFIGSNSLRATIAYNLIAWSKYKTKTRMLDPFMGSGTIPIEAGLFATKTSPFYFSKEKFSFQKIFSDNDWNAFFEKIDKKRNKDSFEIFGYDSLLKYLKFAQKNAKIADINKSINVSKAEIDWIDTKLPEKSIDLIISQPPVYTDKGSTTKILKVYKDMFHRAKDIITKDAIIAIISTKKSVEMLKDAAQIYTYKIIEERIVFEGQDELIAIKFQQE